MKHALAIAIVLAFSAPAMAQDCSQYAGPNGKQMTMFMGGELSARDAAGNTYETCSVEPTRDPSIFDLFCDQRKGQLVFDPSGGTAVMFSETWRQNCPTRV